MLRIYALMVMTLSACTAGQFGEESLAPVSQSDTSFLWASQISDGARDLMYWIFLILTTPTLSSL